MTSTEYASELRELGTAAPGGNRHESKTLPRSDSWLSEQAAALQSRNSELAAYAHTVAHDLKDALSVIIGTSDAIVHISDLTPDELQAYLQQIQLAAHAMDDMIDGLLLLSEVGEAQVPVEALDMGSIMSRVRSRLGYLVREHRAHITVPRAWPVAMGYGPWVEEVWSNFISNAIKYGGLPPSVELGAAAQPDGMVLFWTRDNGAGISQEAQASLFRPSTQLGPVRKPGHGLGLSIVRRIVEKLGGQVGVETEAGRGSQFFFTLPASD